MKFTGIALAGLVSCVAALPPAGFFPPPPPFASGTPSSSALPSSSIAARDFPFFGEPPATPITPSGSASVTPSAFPWGPFEKRQFFPPPPPFPATPSGPLPTPSGTPSGPPSGLPTVTPF